MMNSEIFHLVFNNFKSNISSNWSELREESQFCDVTLACEGSRVEAHKVILSSCSPVIKDLLIQTNHPHPLVYLRGVKSIQIKALLDFIYKGEVDIAKEDLNDFMEIAEELKVKGLAKDDNQSTKDTDKQSKFFGNEDNHTTAKVKNTVPTPLVIIKEENVAETQKTYCEPLQESNYEPHIKMEIVDYYDGEEESCDGEAFYDQSLISENNSFICDKCNNQFPSQLGLNRHMVSVHGGLSFSCKHCDYKATAKGSLKLHVKSRHEGIRYSCDICDYEATQKGSLKMHVKSVHEGVRYYCKQCDYKASNKGNLQTHVQSVHEKITVTCDKCDKKFSSNTNLWKHTKSVHEGVLYYCEQCDYKTKEKYVLQKHKLKQHTITLEGDAPPPAALTNIL